MIKKRKGTKFIKEVEKPAEFVTLLSKHLAGGVIEIGQTSVRFISKKEIAKWVE